MYNLESLTINIYKKIASYHRKDLDQHHVWMMSLLATTFSIKSNVKRHDSNTKC